MNKKGFTLMELLVVVIIIAIFASVTYPTYKSTVERARANEAINLVGAIKAAEVKHMVNYERYGEIFQDINDFEPGIPNFDPSQNNFATEFFTYTLHVPDAKARVEAVRNTNDSYKIVGIFAENFIRCYYTNNDGQKVCSSLTDEESTAGGDGNFYRIF